MRDITCTIPRHMTEDELREWGRHELLDREGDLIPLRTDAPARATARRRAAKLSAAQATASVIWAQRERRTAGE
jgi:hypothetical protein